jgi:hypothetical protein
MEAATMAPGKTTRWLNGTVAGIALASLLSDASHEMASAALPAFLASMGVAAAWLGAIEGISDGISSFAKLLSGHWTDGLARRKKILVLGYAVTALGTASFGFATSAWHVLTARSTAWLGRGVRSPVKKAMLAAAVTPETYGRAFGFERMMDTCGALVGPAAALALLGVLDHDYRTLFFLTLIPGLAATAVVAGLVRERERRKVKSVSFREGLGQLPPRFRRFLLAVGVFGAGDFSHTLLILYATGKLAPTLGTGVARRWGCTWRGTSATPPSRFSSAGFRTGWTGGCFWVPPTCSPSSRCSFLSSFRPLFGVWPSSSFWPGSSSRGRKPLRTPSRRSLSLRKVTAWPSAFSRP